MSYLTAPAPTTYWVSLTDYGRATFPDGTAEARARMWLVHPDGSTEVQQAILRVATNHPKTGRAQFQDFDVLSARTRGKTYIVETSAGEFSLVRAPCVCGAGAVGMVGPEPNGSSNFSVQPMRIDLLDWVAVG